MSNALFSDLRQRTNILIGESSATTSAAVDSHLNASVGDIVNAFPFSWDVASGTGTLSAGSFSLAADYNSKWHLKDARIAVSGTGGDSVFQEVPLEDRDLYAADQYVYWITYDTTLKRHVFTTPLQTGTVSYYYWFMPPSMTAGTDSCPVPDREAVCYLAASKNWLTDERNQALSDSYERKANSRILALWQADGSYGPVYSEGTAVDLNPALRSR